MPAQQHLYRERKLVISLMHDPTHKGRESGATIPILGLASDFILK